MDDSTAVCFTSRREGGEEEREGRGLIEEEEEDLGGRSRLPRGGGEAGSCCFLAGRGEREMASEDESTLLWSLPFQNVNAELASSISPAANIICTVYSIL